MWPFGKKEDKDERVERDSAAQSQENQHAAPGEPRVAETGDAEAKATAEHGPFDGDTINIEEFDFSDFSAGILDLGSVRVPLPRPSEVQVEMGEQGPRMLHIITEYGRITPVAFAAPRTGGVWEESVSEIVSGMEADGLSVDKQQGPWGDEVVGSAEHAVIRIIGCDGPRWTLRLTLAGPLDRADALATLGREVAARTFVYRGQTPMVAGSVLPVVMPAPLVEQVQQTMEQRAAAMQAEQQAEQQVAGSENVPENVPANSQPIIPNVAAGREAQLDNGSALQQMRTSSEKTDQEKTDQEPHDAR